VSPETETRIGNDCYIMSKCYIPHDAVIEDEVKLATTVLLGAFVHIGRAAYLGMGAIVHQRLVIGAGSMVGMDSAVTKHVPPLAKALGVPARVIEINVAKKDLFGLTDDDMSLLKTYFDALAGVNMVKGSAKVEQLLNDFEIVQQSRSKKRNSENAL
jgi:UDP-N-acetylglucosamine acyltransferase